MDDTVTWFCDDCDEAGNPAIFTGPKDQTDRMVETHMGTLGHFAHRAPNPTELDPIPEELIVSETPPRVRIEKSYPYPSGDHWILGPGIFSDAEEPHRDVVVNWAGYNLVDQDRLVLAQEEAKRAGETHKASRAGYAIAYLLIASVIGVLVPAIAALWRWGFGL